MSDEAMTDTRTKRPSRDELKRLIEASESLRDRLIEQAGGRSLIRRVEVEIHALRFLLENTKWQ